GAPARGGEGAGAVPAARGAAGRPPPPPAGSGPGRSRPGETGGGGLGGPLSSEERFVRELMLRSVADVQPDAAALTRIRHGVPRRRALRRGAWTCAAAVALATAVALPALGYPEGLGLSDPAAVGTADSTGGLPSATRTVGGSSAGSPTSPYTWSGASGGTGNWPGAPVASASPSTGAPASGPATAGPGTGGAPAPACGRDDLGQGSLQLRPADAAGAVYGSFTVVNTSGHDCALTGPGTLLVSAAAGSDPAQVKVLDHLAGDAATALPDPVGIAAAGPPVLAPKAAYRVQFGWVPGSSCPGAPAPAPAALGGQPQASPQPVANGASAAPTAGTLSSASPTAAPTSAPSPTASPTAVPSAPAASITLAYTPAPAGSAAVTAVLTGACAGTVYRTAPQPADPPPSGPSTAG
ncbi:hypothetical protein, partial [Kitasatospora sp. NPDC057015]|uniref:hypothetical protein n=1 Tax=Kitasatospora sp. NPDC057015 TaxID=3346001 RepID=UPI0036358E44